jgi:erythromycin esterase
MAKKMYYLLVFGTYKGSVTAGRQWGEDMLIMNVPAAIEGSLEHQLNQTKLQNFMLVMNDELMKLEIFQNAIGHRAIGVIYHPENEKEGNYVPSIVGNRYDVFIFLNETQHLQYVD